MTKKKILTDALTLALASEVLVPDAAATKPEDELTPDPAPVVVPVAAAEAAVDGLTAYLKSEVVTLKAALAEAQTTNTTLQAQVTAFTGDNVPAMKAALGSVIKLIAVPLNATVIGLDDFNGAQLVATYNQLQTQLTANFKPGAKSSSASDEPAPENAPQAPPPQTLTKAARFK